MPAGSGTILSSPAGLRSSSSGSLTERRFVEDDRLAVDAGGVEVVEREREPAEVSAAERRREVDAVGDLLGALDDACEGADHDVGDAPALERGQDRVRVERRLPRPSAAACSRLEQPLHAPLGRE